MINHDLTILVCLAVHSCTSQIALGPAWQVNVNCSLQWVLISAQESSTVVDCCCCCFWCCADDVDATDVDCFAVDVVVAWLLLDVRRVKRPSIWPATKYNNNYQQPFLWCACTTIGWKKTQFYQVGCNGQKAYVRIRITESVVRSR